MSVVNKKLFFLHLLLYFVLCIAFCSDNNLNLNEQDKKPNCAALCFYEVCKRLDVPISLQKVEELIPYKKEGNSMYELFKSANDIGLSALCMRVKWEELMEIKDPVIGFVRGDHFIVINRTLDDKVIFEDPPISDTFSLERIYFEEIWKGEILIISKPKNYASEQLESGKTSAPKLIVDELFYDFGKQSYYNKLKHNFTIRNIGDKELSIYDITVSGCEISFRLPKWNLKPAEETELEILYTPLTNTGFVEESIIIFSNDPDFPQFDLYIYGDIYIDLIISPMILSFDSLTINSINSKNIEITTPYFKNFTINKIESSSNKIETKLEPVTDSNTGGKIFRIKVTYKTDSNIGYFSDELIISSNHPRKPKMIIPILGNVHNEIIVFPKKIHFGYIKISDLPLKRKLNICSKDKDFSIKGINVSDSIIKYNKKTIEKNKNYEIVLSLKDNTKVGKYQDMIKVYTDNKTNPAIEIPILAIIN